MSIIRWFSSWVISLFGAFNIRCCLRERLLLVEKWTSQPQSGHVVFHKQQEKNRCFQSNGHCWKRTGFFLILLGSFSGMCSSNFLPGTSGNFRTFELTFILFIFFFFLLFTTGTFFVSINKKNSHTHTHTHTPEAGVYSMKCATCIKPYIREISRPLTKRIYKHKQAVLKTDTSYALDRNREKHNFDLKGAKITKHMHNKNKRLAIESAVFLLTETITQRSGKFH